MTYPKKTSRERWTDWAGCLAAIALCATLWRRASTVGLLLAPSLIHNLLIAASFLLRRSPRAKVTTFSARASAYLTTGLVPLYAIVVPHYVGPLLALHRSPVLAGAGAVVWLAGCLFGVWGVWNLRYAFSIEPQARQLVTSGPYRFARHPIYTAYLLQYAGILLVTPSVGFALLLLVWYELAVLRVRFEEGVLAQAFPEYGQYRLRVGRFLPALRLPKRWARTEVLGTQGGLN